MSMGNNHGGDPGDEYLDLVGWRLFDFSIGQMMRLRTKVSVNRLITVLHKDR